MKLFIRASWMFPLLVAALPATGQQTAESDEAVLAIIGDEVLDVQAFEDRYIRTVGSRDIAVSDSLGAYEDFLQRYVDFRLKILEAEEAGYTEDPGIQSEIHGYRASFAHPYLVDQEVLAPILTDLYEKRKWVVHASHIMVRLADPNPSPADTLSAFERISALRDSVMQGMEFGEVAMKYSEDPSARNAESPQGFRGDLGTFTAGRMIKVFEDMAYAMPVGEVSYPFRTAYGYHLVKVHSREQAKPGARVAHIMVQFRGMTPEDSAAAYARMDTIKMQLDQGASFRQMAMRWSEDPNSAGNGGEIGTIRFEEQQLDRAFYSAVFSLQDPGDVSDVVQSAFGLHLIKLVDRDSLGTYDEEYDELERLARNMPRMRRAEEQLARTARAEYPSAVDTTLLASLVGGIRRDSVELYLQELALIDSLARMPVATLGDSIYSLGQLAAFSADPSNRVRNEVTPRLQAIATADAFLDLAAITHKALDLEQIDAEFRDIMRDFREGLMLFKLMEDSVWNAAATDSVWLRRHYEENLPRYTFPDRFRIFEVRSYSDSILTDAIARIDSGLTWREFADYTARDEYRVLRLDTVLVDGVTNSVYDRAIDLAVGARTDLLPVRTSHVALWLDGIEPARSKTFDEARAEVISEIQELLEEQLLTRLRLEYGVETYPERLKHVFQ